ncbi:lipocalin [Alteromonas aestuariivivens]|uniref:Outer membrane lipoprotein Blc n=1 Tax=Alteromonas aestuariivivens TaxID=1938339 RepID=A0A3D8M8W6_9ALTE|nr:lipocalin family protein [Alteromonas aestuariivivens]RDV25641.1 lipocalin [Alteromonas aestuariivivens]
MRIVGWMLGLFALTACTTVPENVDPIKEFELSRYLGTWYEIARFEHSFEAGLTDVTAKYQMREDGGVRVINRGYSPEKKQWEEAIGKAYFVGDPTIGHLKVSFFGPFYASYVIIALDKTNYQYALVTGPNRDYLWVLARTPQLPESTVMSLLDKASALGYNTDSLIFVSHSRNDG